MSTVAKWTYRQDQELPSFAVEWRDSEGDLIDFSSGWTFSVKLAKSETAAAVLTKTSGISGASTSPNLVIEWTSGQLNVAVGDYLVFIKATNINGDRRYAPGNEPVITIIRTPIAS